MNLHITPSEKYPRHDIDIPDWFCQKNEFQNQFRTEAEILRETEKAVLVRLVKSGEEHWIPKSISKVIERKEKSLFTF